MRMFNNVKIVFRSKWFKNFYLYLITLFSVELIFSLLSGFDLIDWSTFRIFIGISAFSLLMSLIGSYLPKLCRRIFSFSVIFLLSAYAIFQINIIKFLGVYASLNAASQAGAVTDYIWDFIKDFNLLSFLLLVPFVVSLVLVLKFDKRKELKIIELDKDKFLKDSFIKLGVGIVLIVITSFNYYQTLSADFMVSKNQTINLVNLFSNPTPPTTAVNNFGIFGFLYTDVKSKMFGVKEFTSIVNVNKPASPTEFSREFDDTAWLSLAEKEEDEIYSTIHDYLLNNETTSVNEYTGYFEGKNIIVVMMESVNDLILNAEYFPNFATLLNNGYYYENNYSPRNSCPTGNNEFSGLTGLYSIYNNCTANYYRNNVYPESMFNLFKEENYNVVSMHDYTDHYYYRSTIHPNMGSDAYYGVEDLGIEYDTVYEEWANDAEFAEAAMEIMFSEYNASEDPFALWLTTVSAHQPYTVDSKESLIYEELFADTDYSEEMKRYLSKLKVTDDFFGVLLETLEAEGILEDTVIVAYGDHYPYGLDEDEMSEILDRSFDGYEADRVPFVIYNSSLEEKVIDDYTTFMNILPTVGNLFNLNYDPRLYFGKDLFSPEYESRAVFSDGSWKNEIAYYDASDGEITYFTAEVYTDEKLLYINTKIANDLQISALIIKYNYFNYLYPALEQEEMLLVKPEEEIVAKAD